MTSRPNILFIMADDHAAKAISCYGGGINYTPHLDRIAKDGMLFNHCYVTNSICTPSRAAILTGTYNHVNGVLTLASKINKHLPNVAKHLRTGGYQTAMIGKWHLGEGKAHEPTGFDYWAVIPGQGRYHDPVFIEEGREYVESGYATDIITDKTIKWLKEREKDKPFFVMCHHKAPHRSWECHPKHKTMFHDEDIRVPDTFTDDYKNRAKAAEVAKMRVESDLTYLDLGLVQPEGGSEVGEEMVRGRSDEIRKVPIPEDVTKLRLIDKDTGENFVFKTKVELSHFKYQRYMKRYLRTIASIDENVGRLLDYLDEDPVVAENTMVIYTSDQGFFLGDHGWFDKRFMYEESFQMPFIVRYPARVKPGSVCDAIVTNVDFAPTWLDLAGLQIPSYMQGASFLGLLDAESSAAGKAPLHQVAYHRYWMHRDEFHNAYAHYGIRNRRYKLVFWYNEDYDLPGTRAGGQEKEWELFDCEEDPLELFNVWGQEEYSQVMEEMVRALERKMAEIGDVPAHEVGLPAETLAAEDGRSLKGTTLSVAKAGQRNL